MSAAEPDSSLIPGVRSARERVCRVLADQARRFPDLALLDLDTAGLEPRDAALAHAIYDAVIRRWLTLSHLLDSVLNQPLRLTEPRLQAVLLAGAAQLLLMDRIPAHAAINESVDLAKKLIRPGAGGLTNAVLRKIAGLRADAAAAGSGEKPMPSTLPLADGRSLPLAREVLPSDPLQRLAAVTSHPIEMVQGWSRRLAREQVEQLALHSLVQPPTVFNTVHAAAPLPPELAPHQLPGHHVFTGNHTELLSLLRSRSDVWVQDAASSRAIASVASLKPSLIIDACAGQGTKTRQLAATFAGAQIIATDTDADRFRILSSSFLRHPRVEVVPFGSLLDRFAGRADLILLDVPCSNTGVLARRPEAKYRPRVEQLKRLTGIQRQIIADAIPLLSSKLKGKILYSTCSIDPEENESQVAWALKWHSFRVEHAETLLPAGLPGGDAAAYHDGSFFALLA